MEIKYFDDFNSDSLIRTETYIFQEDINNEKNKYVAYKWTNNKHEVTVSCSVAEGGCPIGCTFCQYAGYFNCWLKGDQIVDQVNTVLKDINKSDNLLQLKIVFGEMGDALFNLLNVEKALAKLNIEFPQAKFYLTTIGPNRGRTYLKLLDLGRKYSNLNIVFIIQEENEKKRNNLIPTKHKLYIRQLRDMGLSWKMATNREVILFCDTKVIDQKSFDADRFQDLFSPFVFSCAFANADTNFLKPFIKSTSGYILYNTVDNYIKPQYLRNK